MVLASTLGIKLCWFTVTLYAGTPDSRRGGFLEFSGILLKPDRHEDAVRVLDVLRKGIALGEAESRIQPSSGLERLLRPRFQAQSQVGAPPGLLDNMAEEPPRDSFSEMCRCRPHRLDLRMLSGMLFEGAAAEELVTLPCGPKRNARLPQLLDRQGVHAFGRREARHALKMLLQQRAYLRPG